MRRGAESLSDALRINSSLCRLLLDRNPIGSAGGVAIAKALRSNSALQMLSLVSCGLDDTAAVEIAKALAENTSLLELNLSRNDVSINVAMFERKNFIHFDSRFSTQICIFHCLFYPF